MNIRWTKSKTPCPTRAAATNQRFLLKPSTANSKKPACKNDFNYECAPRSCHHSEQHIVGGDHDEHGWIKDTLAIKPDNGRRNTHSQRQYQANEIFHLLLSYAGLVRRERRLMLPLSLVQPFLS